MILLHSEINELKLDSMHQFTKNFKATERMPALFVDMAIRSTRLKTIYLPEDSRLLQGNYPSPMQYFVFQHTVKKGFL